MLHLTEANDMTCATKFNLQRRFGPEMGVNRSVLDAWASVDLDHALEIT